MGFGLRDGRYVGLVSLALVGFLATAAMGEPRGGQRGRLFGPPRSSSDDNEPKQTFYQPRELQSLRPAVATLPARLPESPTGSAAAHSGDGPAACGDPLAAAKIELMVDEVIAAINLRRINNEFNRWRGYLANRLDVSAAENSNQEFAGACRLSWYDRLMRQVLTAPAEAEHFTRALQRAVMADATRWSPVMQIARAKLDIAPRDLAADPVPNSPEKALQLLQQALLDARSQYDAAIEPLTPAQRNELATRAYSVFVGGNDVGHTLQDRASGRRLCDLMEKMDRSALLAAAEELRVATSAAFRKQVAALPDQGDVTVPGITGRVLSAIQTDSGTIIVAGRGSNTYHLEQMPEVAAIVDLGGDDQYIDGTVGAQRPILVIVDLQGNDVYRGTRPGIQAGAILGVSLLIDWEGNDVYDAQDVAQASAIAGVGILIDCAGSDIYRARRRVQAHALGGVALLIDRAGDDRYRASMWGQGFGAPLGFGLLADSQGDDHYFLGGMYLDSYKETPGLEGWGQGVGAGIRQVANGGIGVLLEGAGDDTYEFDYLAHGGGYWCGLGFLRDFAGNDTHHGSTPQAYSGGPRREPDFQRFGNGWGCHYAMGFLFDDAGDDSYRGSIMGIGFGWDCALGVLADFGGHDRYQATGTSLPGSGAQGSTGVLFDYDGDDVYVGSGQAYAAPSVSYHPLPACGGNFSFLIDFGGQDEYGCRASNDAITQRGWAGGFLIDRPRAAESAEADAAETATAEEAQRGRVQR